MIVEDEERALRGMEKLLVRVDPGVEIEGTAANGKEGLRLVCETQPDLVLTDVIMPEMDGIEMLHELRKIGMGCAVVFLSGYDTFSFVQSALHLNAVEYLLKPVTVEKVRAMLEQVKLHLLEQERNTLARFGLTQREKELYLSLTGGWRSGPAEGMNGEAWCFLALCFGCPVDNAQLRAVRSLVEEDSALLLPAPDGCTVLALLPRGGGPGREGQDLARRLYSRLAQGKGARPTFLLYHSSGAGEDKERAVEELLEACKWRLLLPGGEPVSLAALRDLSPVPFHFPDELEQAVYHNVMTYNLDSAAELLEKLFRCLTAQLYDYNLIAQALVRLSAGLTHTVELALEEPRGIGALENERLQGLIASHTHISVIRSEMAALLENLGHIYRGKNGNTYLMKRVYEISERQYDQPLNMELLAQKIRISPKYLGAIFLHETGTKYSAYLNALRIRKAQELMGGPPRTIAEISRMVGFSDEKYFQKVFKKLTGVTPGAYAKSIRGGGME